MSTQSDLDALKVLLAKLDSNRVANLSYTDAAFTGDIVDGVDAFNVSAENNIPTKAHTDLNATVINKGFRTQAASIPRMMMNHFLGRVSYNLNKLIQKFSGFVGSIAAHFAHNSNEYDASAAYAPGDVCYVYYPAANGFRKYRRISETPATIVGIPVTNTAHWSEAFEIQARAADFALNASVLAHQYIIDDFDALNPDELTLPGNGDACAVFSDGSATGTPVQDNIAGIISRTADDGSCAMILYSASGTFVRHYDGTAGAWDTWRIVWDSGNDGAGSTLDADLLDGKHANEVTQFATLSYADFISLYATLTEPFYTITELGCTVRKLTAGFTPTNIPDTRFMGRGYAMGGRVTTSTYTEIDGIRFDTEAAINPAVALSVSRGSADGVNSRVQGYAMGGESGTVPYSTSQSRVDGIKFATETGLSQNKALSASRLAVAGVNSAVSGYAMGGLSGGMLSVIDRLLFATDTVSTLSAVLPTARAFGCGVNSPANGYVLGGSLTLGGASTEIDGLAFSTETAINPSAVLSLARFGSAGVSSQTTGFALGGCLSGTTYTTEIDGILFSNETAVNPSAVLAAARGTAAGVSSPTCGYAMGGTNNAASAEIDGIQFSDSTAINPAAVLSLARQGVAGVQSGWL